MPGRALRRRDRSHRRYPRRLLGSGGAAAPERESLALLPSGPDAVRTLPVRGTRSSTPRAQTLSRRTVPRTAFGPAWSGFRVQGTADSPPSVAGQVEGTTSSRDYDRRRHVIDATLYTDAGCPWAYSANPALRVLEWRFREQLSWRLVMIGLREVASEAAVRTYDPERALTRYRFYEERYGMPFATRRRRGRADGHGCRAVVAARLLDPGSEWRCFARSSSRTSRRRCISTTPRASSRSSRGPRNRCGQDRSALDAADVVEEYERQQAEARSAAGTPRRRRTRPRRRTGVRFTAPSVVFRRRQVGRRRRVAAAPLLRHRSRELRPRARAGAAAGVARAPPRVLPGRADDRGGRAAPRGRLRSDSRPRRSRADAARPRRVRRVARAVVGGDAVGAACSLAPADEGAFLPTRLVRLARRCSSRTRRLSSSSWRSRRRRRRAQSADAGSLRHGSRSSGSSWEVGVAAEALGGGRSDPRRDRRIDRNHRARVLRDRRARSLERQITVTRKRSGGKRAELDVKRRAVAALEQRTEGVDCLRRAAEVVPPPLVDSTISSAPSDGSPVSRDRSARCRFS